MTTQNQNLTPKDIIAQGTILTLAEVNNLLGKKLIGTYPVYKGNEPEVVEFTITGYISEWDKAAHDTSAEGFANRQEYWKTIMTPERIQECKNKLCLLTAEGNHSQFFYCQLNNDNFDEPSFTCGDADRPVYFVVA
jgi:hypothetical protein